MNRAGQIQKPSARSRSTLSLMRDNYERGLYEGEEYQYWQKVNGLKEKLELLTRIPESAIERAALALLNLHDSWEWATREERKMLVRTMNQEAGCDVGTTRPIKSDIRADYAAFGDLITCGEGGFPTHGGQIPLSR